MTRDMTTDAISETLVSITPVRSGVLEEYHVTAVPTCPEADASFQTGAMYGAVLAQLAGHASLHVVAERVFGRLCAKKAFLAARGSVLRDVGIGCDAPVTYLEGAPADGGAMAGIQLTLVRDGDTGVQVEALRDGGTVYGFCVKSDAVRRVYLPGMHGLADDASTRDAREQARQMFERTDRLLISAGMSYRQVVCTRIYLKDILDWYDDFNTVRNPFHERVGLSGDGRHQVPASTGIQGKIAEACACFMDVTALLKTDTKTCPFTKLRNPLQNEATDYGSSFARGVQVEVPGVRYVFVSGTASIDETGATVHLGNPLEQTRRTMQNFEAILRAGGAAPADLYHAVWYVKAPAYAALVRDEMTRRDWPAFPYITVKADVCRPDLLVEIDGAAALQVD